MKEILKFTLITRLVWLKDVRDSVEFRCRVTDTEQTNLLSVLSIWKIFKSILKGHEKSRETGLVQVNITSKTCLKCSKRLGEVFFLFEPRKSNCIHQRSLKQSQRILNKFHGTLYRHFTFHNLNKKILLSNIYLSFHRLSYTFKIYLCSSVLRRLSFSFIVSLSLSSSLFHRFSFTTR